MSRESLLDEAIAKAKETEDWQLAEWLRMARGSESAARWYTEKLRELEDENTRLRSCLSEDEENARMIMGEARMIMAENAKLRELVTRIWRTARLMDANEHIDGMRITDEFRASCVAAFAELGIEDAS